MVRKTESKLPPADFAAPQGPAMEPADLGQSIRLANYVLVSYVTSPLTPGSRNDYVVFALGNPPVVEYRWTITDTDSGKLVRSSRTAEGIYDWTPGEPGEYKIQVEIWGGVAPAPALALHQSVRSVTDPGEGLVDIFPFELRASGEGFWPADLLTSLLKHGAFSGEWDSTRELLFELWGYISDAANLTGERGVPAKLLAAVTYQQLIRHPKDFSIFRLPHLGAALRSAELEWAAQELNEPKSFQFSQEVDNAMGVAQVRPETAAMVLGITQWREKPQDLAQRKAIEKQIHADYAALSEDVRIALFNVLRFPRSNIAIAAKLLARLKNRTHRWPSLTRDALAEIEDIPANATSRAAVPILATEYFIGAVDTPAAQAKAHPFGTKVFEAMGQTFLAPFFRRQTIQAPATPFLVPAATQLAFGALSLKEGDVNAEVPRLRAALVELGILSAAEHPIPNAQAFDLPLTFAVREFQAYAKMDYIALEHRTATNPLDRLRSYANLYRYGGPISGVANLETRRRLQAWRASGWRCPVVVQALTPATGAPTTWTVHRHNIWSHDTVQTGAPRMFARDFSRYYELPDGRSEDDLRVIGDWRRLNITDTAGNVIASWNGPASGERSHLWEESELLPDRLVARELTLPRLSAAQRATFKVVRAGSEVECLGFFDSLNSYDNAFVSLGPCHWTLGIIDPTTVVVTVPDSGTVDEGELCGFLAYLAYADPPAFRKAVRFFGVRVHEDWVFSAGPGPAVADGRNLFKGDRKYAGWIAQQNDDSGWVRTALDVKRGNFFKSWHWYYRWQMAGRTIEGFRRRMWDMARIRLRDILSTPWGSTGAGAIADVPDGSGGMRPVYIGDVFTSERATALLLRWHIRYPGRLIDVTALPGGRVEQHADTRLRQAYLNAAIPATLPDPRDWQSYEPALVAGIMTEVNSLTTGGSHRYTQEFRDTMSQVHDWPRWAQPGQNSRRYVLPANANRTIDDQPGDPEVRQLSTVRNSFKDHFDSSGLPPAPNYSFPSP